MRLLVFLILVSSLLGCLDSQREQPLDLSNELLTNDARLLTEKTFPDYNVILISIDTLRKDHMGMYGYHRNTTPFIDEFSRKSMVFDNYYSNSHNTLASHASMLSSLYPPTHKAIPETYFDKEIKRISDYYKEGGFQTAGIVQNSWLGREKGFDKGFDYYIKLTSNASDNNVHIFDWLDNNHDERFFLFLHYYDPHSDWEIRTYETRTAFDTKFIDQEFNDSVFCSDDECASDFLRKINRGDLKPPQQTIDLMIDLYDGGVAYTDYHIGKLLSRFSELGLLENSIIIITSDHGEAFLEHGRALHSTAHEEVAAVPLIVYIPGEDHSIINILSESVDLMPTLLDLSNISYKGLEGESLLNLDKKGKSTYLSYKCGVVYNNQSDCLSIGVRNSDFSLIIRADFLNPHLFDRINDIKETNDLSKNISFENEYALLFNKAYDHYQDGLKIKKMVDPTEGVLDNESIELLKNLGYLQYS